MEPQYQHENPHVGHAVAVAASIIPPPQQHHHPHQHQHSQHHPHHQQQQQQQHQQQHTTENPDMDYAGVKHLLSEAEMHQQQSQLHLTNAESALIAAQSQHAAAKAAYDESVLKVDRLKSQFREQIMDEGLRQSCRWNNMYYRLVEWKEEHDGDTTVPCDGKSTEEIRKLNRWVINQRSAYKYFMNGDKKHIKDHRIDALNKVGFVWSVQDQQWDSNFEALRRHKAETGGFHVSIKQNRKLSTFISRLRTAMSHKEQGLVQQELNDERVNRLNSIDFTWHVKRKQRKTATRDTVKFDVMYGHLCEFKEIYGHTKVNKMEKEWKKGEAVPEKKVFRRLPLFLAFCRKEQVKYVEGGQSSLDEEKIQLLNELGVEWKKPASEPRKNTGGEASRKKKKKEEYEPHYHHAEDPHAASGYFYQEQHHHHEGMLGETDEVDHPALPPPLQHI